MNAAPTLLPTLAPSLTTIDWLVVGAYALLLVATGFWLTRRQSGGEDYFLASRSMPAWAVAISVLATSLSAATFIGGPQQAYAGNLSYLSASIGGILGAIVVALLFLPAFYKLGVSTVYQLLESRFGPGAKRAASAMFMLGRVFASGARIYIAAHAISFVLFRNLEPTNIALSAILLALVGVGYTITGGIATVIWTDVVQTTVFLCAVAIAAAILASRVLAQTGGADALVDQLAASGKVDLLSLSFDPSETYTLWTALIGFTLFNIAAYGADHDLAQRMLTCRSAKRAAASMIGSVLAGIPVTALFLGLGLLLFLYEPTAPGAMTDSDGVKPFLYFITSDLPPGIAGLLVAGVFAAGLSSLDSALNAMASTFVNDFYRPRVRDRDESHYLRISRLAVAGWGAALAGFACLCVAWQGASGSTLLDFALQVMTFAYGGLVGVFLCALLTRRGSSASAIAALLVGLLIISAFAVADLVVRNTLQIAVDDSPWKDGVPLAFPWRLTIAAIVSFLICAATAPKPTTTSTHRPSEPAPS